MNKNNELQKYISEAIAKRLTHLGRRELSKRLGISETITRELAKLFKSEDFDPEMFKQVKQDASPAKEEKAKPVRISAITEVHAVIPEGKVYRVILSAAQDDTPVHAGFLRNLEAYAEYLDADISIGGFTYQKGLFEDHAVATASYAQEIQHYMLYDRARFTKNLLFVADANVLPTATNPLTGWQTANSGHHVVIPHARIAFESIPRMLDQAPRFALTTGCVTIPSYAPRAAGKKALQHHTLGALLIEVAADGEIFFKQLLADPADGSFQNLEIVVRDGVVYDGNRVLSIAWGDWHHDQLDQNIGLASVGYDRKNLRFVQNDNLLDRLKPYYSVCHDTLDFRWRNHHNIHDPIQMAKMAARGTVHVEREVREAVSFANGLRRDWCRTIVIESNHDSAIAKWLQADDGRYDPVNACTWHRLNADWHESVLELNDDFNITEHAFRKFGLAEDVEFISAGKSLVVQDVEHALHGDLGIGGSRGSPLQYRRFGRKVTSAHTHSPRIADGSYVAGVSARLFQGYNVGPTTWAHAHVVLYPNGHRALLIMNADGRYEA